jgi:hypothetical protein
MHIGYSGWVIRGPHMNACVIMHTIIIEDDREKDEDHIHYELIGVSVQVKRPHIWWPVSLPRIIPFGPMIHIMILKKISCKSGGNEMDNNSGYFICIFVVLF